MRILARLSPNVLDSVSICPNRVAICLVMGWWTVRSPLRVEGLQAAIQEQLSRHHRAEPPGCGRKLFGALRAARANAS